MRKKFPALMHEVPAAKQFRRDRVIPSNGAQTQNGIGEKIVKPWSTASTLSATSNKMFKLKQ